MAPARLDDCQKIRDAWEKEGSLTRLALRPAADRAIQKALIPSGGDWTCGITNDHAVTRSILWHRAEVALVNPRGDLNDILEGQIAMGIRATPVMDHALRAIFVLASAPENLALIADIARAAIDYVEQPAPALPEAEE